MRVVLYTTRTCNDGIALKACSLRPPTDWRAVVCSGVYERRQNLMTYCAVYDVQIKYRSSTIYFYWTNAFDFFSICRTTEAAMVLTALLKTDKKKKFFLNKIARLYTIIMQRAYCKCNLICNVLLVRRYLLTTCVRLRGVHGSSSTILLRLYNFCIFFFFCPHVCFIVNFIMLITTLLRYVYV